MKLSNRNIINIIFMSIGIAALIMLIREVTLEKLLEQLRNFGAAFILTVFADLFSTVTSNRGWYHVFQKKYEVPFPRLVFTSLASNSIGDTLTVGQGSELIKANLLRGHAPASEIANSLLLYNYLHVFTTSSVVVLSAIFALFAAPFELTIRLLVVGIAIAVLTGVTLLGILLRKGVFFKLFNKLQRFPIKWLRPSDSLLEGATKVDERLGHFTSDSPSSLYKALFWLFWGRIFNLIEIGIILYYLGLPHSIAVVAMVYSTTAIANYLLMILPTREGFVEGSSYLIFGWIGMKAADGLFFEMIRRIRKIFFQLLGLTLFVGFFKESSKNKKELPIKNSIEK